MNNKVTWRGLSEILWQRFISPFSDPVYCLYFLSVIVVIGSLGVWIQFTTGLKDQIIISASTYFIAILATSTVTVIIKDFDESVRRYRNALVLTSLFVFILGIAGFIIIYTSPSICLKSVLSTVGVFLSLVTWWVANADNSEIRKGSPPNTKEVTDEEEPISGTLDGYTS